MRITDAAPSSVSVRFRGFLFPVCMVAGRFYGSGLPWRSGWGAHNVHVSSGPAFEDFHLLSTVVLGEQGVELCPVELLSDQLSRGDLVPICRRVPRLDDLHD